jgi:hypothetical protein
MNARLAKFNEARDLFDAREYAGAAETACEEAFRIITVAKMRNQPTEAAELLRMAARQIQPWAPSTLWRSHLRAADILLRRGA